MRVENPVLPQAIIEQTILADHGDAGKQLGYDAAEIVAAFAPGRPDETHAVLNVKGIAFDSFRYQVGVHDQADRSRGGLELSENVTPTKIFHKSTVMEDKHMIGETGNVGGKSGIAATPEELAEIGTDGEDELMAQHALAHGINPYTNVVATDIRTYGHHMDAITEALLPTYGTHAAAAASGASKQYGGEPELQAPKTGLGASIVLDRYLHSIAPTNSRVAEAMNGGAPLRILVQALGKAGAHFLRTMPSYIQPIGVLEYKGGIVATDGYLDREQLLATAPATRFGKAAADTFSDITWLPPEARAEFWATAGAEILAPAFDENQVDADDIEAFTQNHTGIVVANIANRGVTPEGQKKANQSGVDILPDMVTNIGGTISSQLISEKILGAPWWTPAAYEKAWNDKVTSVADTTLSTRSRLSSEMGRFVSLEEAAGMIIVGRAVRRMRAARAMAG